MERGSSRALWALVRKLRGKARRKGHIAAAVIKGAQGNVLGDSEAVNAAWLALFKQEFRNVGLELAADDEFFSREPVPREGAGEPLSLQE